LNIETLSLTEHREGIFIRKITAKVQTVDLAQFSQLCVTGVIAKPFDPLTLAQQMASTLGW
jgi:CheY-like chemotaxis protein